MKLFFVSKELGGTLLPKLPFSAHTPPPPGGGGTIQDGRQF